MGYLNAYDTASYVADLDEALRLHLTSNHYPPVPTVMVAPCRAALEAILDDQPELPVELPSGCTYRGGTAAPARAIAEQHHLQGFLDALRDADHELDWWG